MAISTSAVRSLVPPPQDGWDRFFAFFALSWIFPYAVVTVRARGWLTR